MCRVCIFWDRLYNCHSPMQAGLWRREWSACLASRISVYNMYRRLCLYNFLISNFGHKPLFTGPGDRQGQRKKSLSYFPISLDFFANYSEIGYGTDDCSHSISSGYKCHLKSSLECLWGLDLNKKWKEAAPGLMARHLHSSSNNVSLSLCLWVPDSSLFSFCKPSFSCCLHLDHHGPP